MKIKLIMLITMLMVVTSGCGKENEVEIMKINKVKNITPQMEVVHAAEENKENKVELKPIGTAVKPVETEERKANTDVKPVETEEREVTLSFVGDCTLGGYKGQSQNGAFSEYFTANGADYFFENVRDIFENDDFTVINLEGPLTNLEQTVQKEFPIKGLPEYVDIMTGSSVEIANLANNHTRDCGEAGFEETKQLLSNNNIGYFGENSVYVTSKNGVRIGFAGYRGWNVSDELMTQIKNDIEYIKAENEAHVAVVVFHYGDEGEHYNNEAQEKISKYAIDCGADIVIGGHPHVMQGIEIYKGKTICYSLGNFSFGANKNPKDKDTFIYQQTFRLNESNEVEYTGHKVIPCSISSESNRNTYKPTPLHDEDYERVLKRLKDYSSNYETSIFDIINNRG